MNVITKDESENRFYFRYNYGLFVGRLDNNTEHKHYAIQISLSSDNEFICSVKDNQIISCSLFINSNIQHKLSCNGTQLIILVNPISRIGHFLHLKYSDTNYKELDADISDGLTDLLTSYVKRELTFDLFCSAADKILEQFVCNCDTEFHPKDDRIVKAIKYLDDNAERVVSLKEISDICFLSQSRFLHLFKEKTGIHFRRYQLWNRLIKSLPYLSDNNITTVAHQFGFSDSSHYTRTFKETFGLIPKFFVIR